MARKFVETNILIYSVDADAGRKHQIARKLISDLWMSNSASISTQVLQEFYVNVTRKISNPLPPARARDLIEVYEAWEPIQIDTHLILRASEIQERWHTSFWDALIFSAAEHAGAECVYTDDLNHGQLIAGIELTNPF